MKIPTKNPLTPRGFGDSGDCVRRREVKSLLDQRDDIIAFFDKVGLVG
ncbi:hypothetical protein [Bifidobacterium adolescentis]|nr:hypothetical protein [Bifidobacterium adolescentis]